MTAGTKTTGALTGKAQLRMDIVEISRGLHKVGMIDDAELEQTTLRMLGKDALPKVAALSPAEIARVRQTAGLSQSVLAGYMNVAVNTVSQWERGERRPTGAALKLLHVVKRSGIEALR